MKKSTRKRRLARTADEHALLSMLRDQRYRVRLRLSLLQADLDALIAQQDELERRFRLFLTRPVRVDGSGGGC